jgi:O-antigen ligase
VLFVPLQIALAAGAGRRAFAALDLGARAASAVYGAQWVLLALTATTLFLTQSRGAWAGCAIAAMAFLGWYNWRTRALALGAALVCGVAALVAGPQQLLNLAISQSGSGMAGNVSGRVELWSRALYGIADVPLTGMGMNTSRKVLPILYPTFLASPDFDFAHAHNQLLQAGLDLGIPGLTAYLALWLISATLLVRVYRRSREPNDRVMAGGLGAGLIAQFSFGMTDAITLGSKPAVLFWFMLALIVSLHRIVLIRGASPLGLPYTLSRAPLRRRAPFPPPRKLRWTRRSAFGAKAGAWLTRCRSFADAGDDLQRIAGPGGVVMEHLHRVE